MGKRNHIEEDYVDLSPVASATENTGRNVAEPQNRAQAESYENLIKTQQRVNEVGIGKAKKVRH